MPFFDNINKVFNSIGDHAQKALPPSARPEPLVEKPAPHPAPEPVAAPQIGAQQQEPVKMAPAASGPIKYPIGILKRKPIFTWQDTLRLKVLGKDRYRHYKIYLILEDDNTAHTYMIRHTIIDSLKQTRDFYWMAYNGFNYEAESLDRMLHEAGVPFKGNESCTFFFIERKSLASPGELFICKPMFSQRAAREIENSERSKLKDRVAERTFFGISKRWRPAALGDDLMKVLVFGIVIMLLSWVVLTNLPGVLSTISNNVDAHRLNATVGAVIQTGQKITST